MSNGLVYIRLKTLSGDEDRDKINLWNNVPIDCNGIHQRLAAFLGNIDKEVIISIVPINTLHFEGETLEDYRVPDGVWWETHCVKVLGDSINGFIFISSFEYGNFQTIHYDEFIEKVIEMPNVLLLLLIILTIDNKYFQKKIITI